MAERDNMTNLKSADPEDPPQLQTAKPKEKEEKDGGEFAAMPQARTRVITRVPAFFTLACGQNGEAPSYFDTLTRLRRLATAAMS
eukprot:scaffold242817_cov31-Tisochrysis_lutea.AAC.2